MGQMMHILYVSYNLRYGLINMLDYLFNMDPNAGQNRQYSVMIV